MAARTQTVTRSKPAASRAYDHLYDPTYSVSSERDHARAQARMGASRAVNVPNAENMFSALKHHPSSTSKVKSSDPVPPWVAQEFDTMVSQHQAQDQRDRAAVDPRGRDFVAKHVARPRHVNGAGESSFGGTIRAAAPPPKPKGFSEGRRLKTPTARTVAIQTDYRESETQTDPWTPDYVVEPGTAPEILTLTTLSYGQGLPAGLAEVEMIERARAKRAWEETLPTDGDKLAVRQRMMEEQEAREWKVREEEIAAIQSQRFELMKKLLVERETRIASRQGQRLERLQAQRIAEKEEKMRKIEHKGMQTLRKLQKGRANVEGTLKRRNVVDEYASPASEVYAPNMTMSGTFSRTAGGNNMAATLSRTAKLSSLQSLIDLESTLPQRVTQPRVYSPQRNASTRGKRSKDSARMQETLSRLDRTFKMQRTGTMPKPAELRCKRKVEKPAERPPTPVTTGPSEEEEAREAAILCLQKMLRGRSVQNSMFDKKEERRELIDELRSTHALQKAEQQLKDEEKAAFLEAREAQMAAAHAAQTTTAVISEVQAAEVGDTLDFLSKELVRLQEQRRIQAFAMLAERERLKREAAESGLRQAQEQRRAQNDEVFRQIVNVHQETVESYLEDIIMQSTSVSADEQARECIRERAKQIDQVAEELHASGKDSTELGAEAIAADLVSSFLLPEVRRQEKREQLKREQRRHLQAAHKELHQSSVQVEGISRSRPKSQTNPVPEDLEEMEV